jgi:hypothetical protein
VTARVHSELWISRWCWGSGPLRAHEQLQLPSHRTPLFKRRIHPDQIRCFVNRSISFRYRVSVGSGELRGGREGRRSGTHIDPVVAPSQVRAPGIQRTPLRLTFSKSSVRYAPRTPRIWLVAGRFRPNFQEHHSTTLWTAAWAYREMRSVS